MQKRIVALAILCIGLVTATARTQDDDIPAKAVCATCGVRGATHGEEDVAAWREYEGKRYYFCSTDCAAAFDGFPTAYIEHPLPRPAPNATLSMLSGGTIDMKSLRGSVVLVDFWATWCMPCRKSMPLLNELHGDSRVKVIGIAIDEEPGKVVPKFVKQEKLRYPIALDGGKSPAWYAYHVAAIPAMFLIDTEGQIVAEWRGEFKPEDVRQAVEQLLTTSNKGATR